MTDDLTSRLERLLRTARHARRTEQELIAAAPRVVQALSSLIAEHPTVLECESAPLYHVKDCWWRLPHFDGSSDFHGFPPRRGTPGLTVASAVCRDSYVLTTPRPSFDLVEIHFTYATTRDEEEHSTPGTPPNDFAYAADDRTWKRVALELDPLIQHLETHLEFRLTNALAGLKRVAP